MNLGTQIWDLNLKGIWLSFLEFDSNPWFHSRLEWNFMSLKHGPLQGWPAWRPHGARMELCRWLDVATKEESGSSMSRAARRSRTRWWFMRRGKWRATWPQWWHSQRKRQGGGDTHGREKGDAVGSPVTMVRREPGMASGGVGNERWARANMAIGWWASGCFSHRARLWMWACPGILSTIFWIIQLLSKIVQTWKIQNHSFWKSKIFQTDHGCIKFWMWQVFFWTWLPIPSGF
jgi:hypothetical protein